MRRKTVTIRMFCPEIIPSIKREGVAVIPTDTLYGIVARADNSAAVERVYNIRGRDPKKPMIVLIAEKNNLKVFNISLSSAQNKFLDQVWPGKVSVVLSCADKNGNTCIAAAARLHFAFPTTRHSAHFLKKQDH